MSDKKDSILQELFDAFKYMRESKKGKYSLDTYLDIIGEYTDRLILQCQKDGCVYMGGNCKVCVADKCLNQILFRIELFFEDKEKKGVIKEAERHLECSKFTTESVVKIKENGELIFEIEAPAGRK